MSNLFKKVTSSVGVIAVAVSSVSSTLTVQAASTFAPYADALATAGIIGKQSAEAGYRLGDSVTRAEMAKIAVNIKGAEVKEVTGKVFSDVNASLGDLAKYIEAAANAGLVSKTNAKFRPLDLVTRAEALKMLLNAKGISPTTEDQGFKDIANTGDLAGYINAAAKAGIINKGASFNPNNTATRGESFKIASNSAGLTTSAVEDNGGDDLNLGDLFGDTTSTGTTTSTGATTSTGTTVVVTGGDVEVSLAASTPASTYTPIVAQNVAFAKYDFTAGSKDTTINSLKFKRVGVGSRNDFAGVYLRSNNVALANEKTIDTTNYVEFSNINLVVKAGSTVSVEVVANMGSSASANSQNAFSLESASMISSNGSVKGSFPVVSNTMTMSSVGVATLKVTSTTQASDPTLGSKGVVLGTMKFENTDRYSTDHRVDVRSITLEQVGTTDAKNLDNLGLYDGATKIASLQTVDKDDYVLVFNSGFVLADGNSKTLDLKGDVVGGKAAETIQFALNDNSDVVALDIDANNVGAHVSSADSTTTNFGSSTYYVHGTLSTNALTIKAGDVTATFDGPATKDMAWGDKDVVLLESTITSQRNVEIKELSVGLTLTKGNNTTIDSTAIKNIKVVDGNGNTLMGPSADLVAFGFHTTDDNSADSLVLNGSTSASDTKSYTDSFYIKAGEAKKIKVVAELSSTADNDLTNVATTVTFGSSSVKDVDTNKYVATASITPTTVSGKTHNVVANSLTMATASSPAATTIIKGSKAVKVAGVSLKAGDAGALTVKSMKFTFAGTAANTAKDVLNNLKLVDANGVALDSSNISDGTPDTVTFDGFTYTVAKGATQLVYVVADVLDTASATDLKLNVSSTSDVSVVEADGDTLTPTGTPTGNLMTIETAGAFTISPLTVDSKNSTVQAGTAGKEVARYELKSSKEKFNVKKLTFDFTGSSETIKAMKLKIGSVEKTEYSITSNEVTFSNINAEVDGTAQMSLFVDFDSMDTNGNNTGKAAKFVLADDNDSAETEVVGAGSSTTINNLTDVDDSSTNKTYYSRVSKLTFAKVTSGLVADLDNAASDAVLYAASVTNSNGGSVDLGKLTFNIILTDDANDGVSALADIKLWINNSIVTSSDATYSATTAAEGTTNITVTLNSNNKGLLSAGSSADLKLTADVTSDDADTLAVDMSDDDTNNFVLTAKKATGNIVNGQLDVDGDGTTASDADDDLTSIVLNGTSYAVVNGAVDIDADGTTASDADDDLASASINGSTYNIVDGEFDIDADATATTGDADDDLTITRNLIWSDKASPTHADTTSDWANGYGLNMDVLTNNSFNNKQ